MAHKHNFVFVLLLLATSALAQTVDSKTVTVNDQASAVQVNAAQVDNNQPLPKQVALARCAYSQADESCLVASIPPAASNAGSTTLMAQIPRRMGPIGPMGPPMRGAGYPGTWGAQFSPGHALIGAVVGFGFGAAVAAKDGGVRGSIAVGTLFGLLGAAVGSTIPAFPSHYRYRRGWDDDEGASRAKPKPLHPGYPRPDTAGRIAARPDAPKSTTREDDPEQAAVEAPQNNAFSSR